VSVFRARLKKWSMVFLPVESRFSLIYKKQYWGDGQSESASGQGSSLAATENIRKELPRILKELNCRKIMDLGCGDFNWMRTVQLEVDYLGVDVVEQVIKENTNQKRRNSL